MTDETIQDRLERAQSQNMDVTLVDTDPVIVQVYNEASDRIHTVIPDSIHCSCEDHTYRGTICKHLLELLQDEGHIGAVTREALKEHKNDLEHEAIELREQVEAVENEISEIVDALSALDVSLARKQTATDIVDALEDYDPDEDGTEIPETPSDAELEGQFAEMVNEMTGDEE